MMTNWDKVVSEKELTSAKNLRRKTYIDKKERRVALPELEEEGWEEFKTYKDQRYIKVRKNKLYDELFEDKVWLLFANMGFTHMNKDRNFKMQYDYHNSNITQQIDIFAADEETILIVECKAASELKNGSFKKHIEAYYAQMNGLRTEARKKFPKRQVKFIWATENYILNESDLEKLDEWDIVHFNDSTINYYNELTKHLGESAKYQLLGYLFANQDIRNMDNKIPAIEGKMGGYRYYSFSIEPEKLLKIGYVLHRNEANKNMMPTYQRLVKKTRLKKVQSFIDNGGYFPNSLIISIDSNGKGIQFDHVGKHSQVESAISRLGILHLPKKYRSAYIIDGQHRLYGYSDSNYARTNSIPVVAFIDLNREDQIKMFMDINENQKSVSKTLRTTLNADMLWVSDNYNERRQALRSKIAQMLGEENKSPLFDRVVVGENEKNTKTCITVEAIQLALKKCNYFSTYDKKNIINKIGTFDLFDNQDTYDLFYPFIESCLDYIKTNLEVEWNKGEDGILTINRGLQAIIRVINDIIEHLINEKEIDPKKMKTKELINEVKYYLDPLIDFIDTITDENRNDLKGSLGASADKKYWRTFQKAISDFREDFIPDGLNKYLEDEAKTFNSESSDILREIKIKLKDLMAIKLDEYYGENWIIHGLPKAIYKKAKAKCDDENYEIEKNNNYMVTSKVSIWDCINLSDCVIIATNYGKNWSSIFESVLVMPKDLKIPGGKKEKISWLKRLSNIDQNINKPNYSVSKEDYELLKDVLLWLESNKESIMLENLI